jgi:hypothetical protein
MAINVRREGDFYRVTVTPPHGGGRYWSSRKALTADDVVNKLRKLGCHQTDIGDAMFEADPDWLSRLTKVPS